MVIKLIGAFLAEIGFGILFNIHGQKLWAAAFTGTLGSLIYELVMQIRGGEVLAMFLAACGLCLVSELLARPMKTPVTTFLCSDSLSSRRRHVLYDARDHPG